MAPPAEGYRSSSSFTSFSWASVNLKVQRTVEPHLLELEGEVGNISNLDAVSSYAADLEDRSVAVLESYLGQTVAGLARTIGLSEPTVFRLIKGDFKINPDKKEGELSLLLVRVYRSLDALVGTDDQKRKAWMTGYNKALGGIPIQLIERAVGLVATLNYLEVNALEIEDAGNTQQTWHCKASKDAGMMVRGKETLVWKF
jgi:hypothetical protein